MAYFFIDHDGLDEHEWAVRVGGLEMRFYDTAAALQMYAISAVLQRLARLVQVGLVGFVSGEVVDVGEGVRMGFVFGAREE